MDIQSDFQEDNRGMGLSLDVCWHVLKRARKIASNSRIKMGVSPWPWATIWFVLVRVLPTAGTATPSQTLDGILREFKLSLFV